jgi:hypothetical protein
MIGQGRVRDSSFGSIIAEATGHFKSRTPYTFFATSDFQDRLKHQAIATNFKALPKDFWAGLDFLGRASIFDFGLRLYVNV